MLLVLVGYFFNLVPATRTIKIPRKGCDVVDKTAINYIPYGDFNNSKFLPYNRLFFFS